MTYSIKKVTDVGGNPRFEDVDTNTTNPTFDALGIGQATIDDSAILELLSTTKGMLPTRMTSTQRDAISSPAEALELYDLTNHKKDFYNGTAWKAFVSSPASTFIPGCVMFATDSHEIDDDSNFFWDNTNKRLGIGTGSPDVRIEASGTTMGAAAVRTTGITVPGTFDLLRKNGTEASPTAVLNDDILSYILFRGYDTVGEVDEGVRFTVTATENWTSGSHGSKFEIGTATNGISTIYTRIIIDGEGNVGIGTPNPSNLLHVNGRARVDRIIFDRGGVQDPYIERGSAGVAKGISFYTGDIERMIIREGGNIGIGLVPTSSMSGLSIEAGMITIKERTTPTADTGYGKVYTKNDNKLYFQDGAGVEHEIAYV